MITHARVICVLYTNEGTDDRPVAWFLNGGDHFNGIWSNFSAKEIWERQRREFLGGSGGMLPREIFEKLAL